MENQLSQQNMAGNYTSQLIGMEQNKKILKRVQSTLCEHTLITAQTVTYMNTIH